MIKNKADSIKAEPVATQLEGGGAVRWPAVLLGLVLALMICVLTPVNNIQRQATPLGGGHFPLAPFYILVWLTTFVAIMRKITSVSFWLNGKELLVIWIMMVLSSGIAYTGLTRTFLINLTAPYQFATAGNRWETVLHPLLPKMWYPQNGQAITDLYNGLPGGRDMGWMQVLTQIPWSAWWGPITAWGVFILLSFFVMVCMVNLLNRQPLYNERMNFPLLRVPMILEEALDNNQIGTLWSNRFLLAGLLIPVFWHLLNGLHFYYPQVPEIPRLILAGPYFPKHGLFAGFAKLKIYLYPAFIGFAFLTAKQISFSLWFCFISGGLLVGLLGFFGLNVPAAALGVTFGPTLARPEEAQMIGAYAVFFLFLAWIARHHFLDVLRQATGRAKTDVEKDEWLSLRGTFWGFVLGSLGLMIWMHYFGMPLLVAFLVICAFFMVTLVATRVICQGGIAYFTLTAAPIDGLLLFFGPKFFTQVGLIIAAVAQKVLFLDLREALMPSLMHARKVNQKTAGNRLMFWGIVITLFLSVVVSFLAMLALCYKFGVRDLHLDWATRTSVAVYDNLYSLIESPLRPGRWILIFSIAGAAVMAVLVICYHRFYWWPLHPIGYLVTYSSAMRILWFSFFVGWLANALCMRYGGVGLFRKLRFFFIGLIIGDFLMGGTWAIIGLFGDSSYQVLPT